MYIIYIEEFKLILLRILTKCWTFFTTAEVLELHLSSMCTPSWPPSPQMGCRSVLLLESAITSFVLEVLTTPPASGPLPVSSLVTSRD